MIEFKWSTVHRDGKTTQAGIYVSDGEFKYLVDENGKTVTAFVRSGVRERFALDFDGDLDDDALRTVCRKFLNGKHPLENPIPTQVFQVKDTEAANPRSERSR